MRVAVILCAIALCGCVSKPPTPDGVLYHEVPESWLQPCELPEAPHTNGDLSAAYVVAYQCAEQGNRDKARIRELVNPT